MARWILLLLTAGAVYAQSHVALSTRSATTTEKVTIQHDPAAPARIQVCSVVVNSTVDGTVSTEVGGSAATTTEIAEVSVSPGGPTPKAKVYQASNVGTGTLTSRPMRLQANIPFILNLKSVRLSGPGTTKNFTVVIALGSSGDVTTSLYWAEDESCLNP